MYLPRSFHEDRPAVLTALIQRHSFATVVSTEHGVPVAGHLPLLYAPDAGPHGVLRGHMARANPQWRGFDGRTPVLAIFHGPHAYVSPSWYTPGAHVPTWNYAAVHAYGPARVVDDAAWFETLLRDLVETYESPRAEPWQLATLPRADLETLMRAIVGFEIPVERLEGKLKLSQNRADVDRERVTAGFATSEDPGERAVGELMRATYRGREP